MANVTAFVLAGGKSSRMGRDKAFLKLGDETFLERASKLAASVTENVCIVGGSAKFSMYGPVVEDLYPDQGPLGGIHAALIGTATEFNLMIAVDTPFIEISFLEFLISESSGGGAVVTVPRTGGHLHPLCAIYRRQFATTSEEALIRGQNRIDTLFTGVRTRVIEEEEMALHEFPPEMFRNVNTPGDWEDALVCLGDNQKDMNLHLEGTRTK